MPTYLDLRAAKKWESPQDSPTESGSPYLPDGWIPASDREDGSISIPPPHELASSTLLEMENDQQNNDGDGSPGAPSSLRQSGVVFPILPDDYIDLPPPHEMSSDAPTSSPPSDLSSSPRTTPSPFDWPPPRLNDLQGNLDYWVGESDDESVKGTELEEVHILVNQARKLQESQDYVTAFSILGKALELQLRIDHYGWRTNRKAIGRTVALIFEQYPELAQITRAQESPNGSLEVAVGRLTTVQDTSGLDNLITLRIVADWVVANDGQYQSFLELANNLYARTYVLMENALGQQHIEMYRLLHHWSKGMHLLYENDWSHDDESDLARAEDSLLRALAGYREVLGPYDPETIECSHALAQVYFDESKYSLAEELLLPLYTALKVQRGTDDIWTLRSLGHLAESYAYQNKRSETSHILWSAPSPDREKTTVNQRFSYEWQIRRLERALAEYGTTKAFRWESKALYCLPIRNVAFQSVTPSDQERIDFWHPAVNYDLFWGSTLPDSTTIKYGYNVVADETIDLVIPYIPYSHYLQSDDFKAGFLYWYHVKSDEVCFDSLDPDSRDTIFWWLLDEATCPMKRPHDKTLCRKYVNRSVDLPTWSAFGGSVTSPHSPTISTGFFNNIPGDTAIFDDNGDGTSGFKFNLISSNWVDFKQFTMHTTAKELMPQLITAEGEPINCQGYISGTWTSANAEDRWHGLMVYVVDAVFREPGSSTDHHFLFSSDGLQQSRKRPLTPEDKRALCAFLNPTLFLFSPSWAGPQALAVPSKRKAAQFKGPSLDSISWDEMNRREAWDREFEKRALASLKDHALMEEDKKKEMQMREQWDLELLRVRAAPTRV